MGLDITAYEHVKLIRAVPCEAMTNEDWTEAEGPERVYLYLEKAFAATADGLVDGIYQHAGKKFDFHAGSYGSYNAWRDQLAALIGAQCRDIWNEPDAPGPFVELINNSDCEGIIGPKTSAKLAWDFAEWQGRADKHNDEWFRESYGHWRKAFEIAAIGGCVKFH